MTMPGHQTRRLSRSLAALALGSALLLPGAAWAQSWRPKASATPPKQAQIDEAKDRYSKGIKLYEEDGLTDAALAELERAYDLAPN